MKSDKTITEQLLDAGYRHEPSPHLHKKRIIEISTGREVGFMDVHQACEFLQTLSELSAMGALMEPISHEVD